MGERQVGNGLLEGSQGRTSTSGVTPEVVAAAMARLALEPRTTPDAIAAIAARSERPPGAGSLTIGLLALSDPLPLGAPLEVAAQAHVTLLTGLAGHIGAAIWRVDRGTEPALVASVGSPPPQPTGATMARAACGAASDDPVALVRAFGEPVAVMTWASALHHRSDAGALAARSVAFLGIAFERAALLGASVGQHVVQARSAERRLSRVALDLHDGPLQDVALLRGQLAALRATMACGANAGPGGHLARIDDLQAIAEATETDLRELASSMECSSLLRRPFGEAMRGLSRSFALRSGIEPALTIAGPADELSALERGALLRVVGEALANVREHSGACSVEVSIDVGPSEVAATVRDDGRGFDVAAELPAAARRGSLGVLGMIERIRQLGGTCTVDTRPGAGTAVRVSFARVVADRVQPAVGAAVPRPAAVA